MARFAPLVVLLALFACGTRGASGDRRGRDAGVEPTCARRSDAAVHVTPSPTYLKASNSRAGAEFGTAVAISADGLTLAVGAAGDASDGMGVCGAQREYNADGSGAVYVFVATDGAWVQEAYIKASNTGAGDGFGSTVALSADGSTLAVGAAQEDSDGVGVGARENDDSAPDSGAVYVFERAGGTWSQRAYVKAADAAAGARFGSAVSLSADGSTLAVGADGRSFGTGAAYLFVRAVGTWTQRDHVEAFNPRINDAFGGAVALSADGSTLAVGARQELSNATGIDGDPTDTSATNAGAVYVFAVVAAVWTQQAYVKASNTDAMDQFGSAVALSADGATLAVGARGESSNATGIDGDLTSNYAVSSGAVYVFVRTAGVWAQEAYVKASNTDFYDVFGESLALTADGSTLAAGARSEDSSARGVAGDPNNDDARDSGAVYVFSRVGAAWSQHSYVKASNADSGDLFGVVALAAHGERLAVGAIHEASSATGVDGDATDNSTFAAGAAYVFSTF